MKERNESFTGKLNKMFPSQYTMGYSDCKKQFQKKIDLIKDEMCKRLFSSSAMNYATCDLICSNYVNTGEWKKEKKRYDKKYVDSLKIKKCANCGIIEKILKGK